MNDRFFQIVLSVASLVLLGLAVVMVVRFMGPARGTGPALERPTNTVPDRVEVWLASGPGTSQMLFKPYLESREGNAYHDSVLSRRFGVEDGACQFFLLLVANFHATEPVELAVTDLILRARCPDGPAAESLSPASVLASAGGALAESDRFVARALGFRPGPYAVPPLNLARFLVAFGSDSRYREWTSLILHTPAGGIPFVRGEILRTTLERFLLKPSAPLQADLPVEIARKPPIPEKPSARPETD